MDLACELTVGYVQKILNFKNNALLSCFSENKMGCHCTGEELSAATGWPGRAGLGRHQSNRGVTLGAAEQCRKGARVLEGSLFLTACFFVCFIQLLERVQQFLWGENVRGSWEGREDSELTYLLQPEASVPDSPSPQPWSGSSGS